MLLIIERVRMRVKNVKPPESGRHASLTQQPYYLLHTYKEMAGALGFEPRLMDPESIVLPLYYAPAKGN